MNPKESSSSSLNNVLCRCFLANFPPAEEEGSPFLAWLGQREGAENRNE